MNHKDRDIIKLLSIQAKTLQRIGDMAGDIMEEVTSQKQFLARVYREIKKDSELAEENNDICEEELLPSNVVQFPGD
mgnify:CR=1 FL=1